MTSKLKHAPVIKLIAAVSRNRVIGIDGHMPWYLKDDLRHFREITAGHTVIMGRKTYETIGHPLDNRENIVISHTLDDDKVKIARSPEEALGMVQDECFIIGGETLYNITIDIASEIYLTYIDAVYDGDTYFPEFDVSDFEILDYENIVDEIPHAYIHLRRKI